MRGVPMRIDAAPADEESQPLMQAQRDSAAIAKNTNRTSRITLYAVLCVLLIFAAVLCGVGLLVWRVNDNMHQMEELIRPHAQEITNATVEMMRDMGGSFMNMKEISRKTNEIAHMPTAPIEQSLDNAANITTRLREFLQHPTIQLSLGGNG